MSLPRIQSPSPKPLGHDLYRITIRLLHPHIYNINVYCASITNIFGENMKTLTKNGCEINSLCCSLKSCFNDVMGFLKNIRLFLCRVTRHNATITLTNLASIELAWMHCCMFKSRPRQFTQCLSNPVPNSILQNINWHVWKSMYFNIDLVWLWATWFHKCSWPQFINHFSLRYREN